MSFKQYVHLRENAHNEITGKFYGTLKKIRAYIEAAKAEKEGSSEDIMNLVLTIPQRLSDTYDTFAFESDKNMAYSWAMRTMGDIKEVISSPQYGKQWGAKLQKSELGIIDNVTQAVWERKPKKYDSQTEV